MYYLFALAAIIAGYLLGSISFAVLFGRVFAHKDVRKHGSGNAGMTNVMRVAGVLPGLLTFICDASKCYLSSYIGYLVFDKLHFIPGYEIFEPYYGAWLCGLACLFGHVFPLFFHFRGGKAVSCGFGLLIYCSPLAAGISLAAFLIVFLITRIISAASITAAVAAFVSVMIINIIKSTTAVNWTLTVFAAVMSLLILIKHRDNIKRLIKGEEKQLKVK